MRRLVTLVLLALATPTLAFGQSDSTIRPDPEAGPTEVEIGLYVLDVESINEVGQSFTVDIMVRLRWQDARLQPVGARFPLDEVWHPRIGFLNQRSQSLQLEEAVVVRPGNTVQYSQRYRGQFSSRLDLRSFPLDQQVLALTLVSFGYSPDEMQFVEGIAAAEENFSIPGWAVAIGEVQIGQFSANLMPGSGEEIYRPRIDLLLLAERHLNFYRWKVLAPLSCIVFLSWAVFLIDPSQIAPQIGVAATSILTTIAFLLSLESLIPPVPYLTRMDQFVYSCLGLVFLAFVEALVTARISTNPAGQDLGLKIDRWCRGLFPLAYLTIVVLAWVV